MQLTENSSNLVKDHRGFGLTEEAKLSIRSYVLRVGDYDVCDMSIRTVETPSGSVRAVGVLPQLTVVQTFADDAWQSRESAVNLAVTRLRAIGVNISSVIVTKSAKCLYVRNDKLLPAWHLIVRLEDIPYQVFVGPGEVLEGDVLGFDVKAKVKAYASNPKDGKLIDFDVNVSGDGYLTNEYFKTRSGDASIPRQLSPSNSFTQSPNSVSFAEQSLFAHVNQHFEFAVANGYVWSGPKPLTIMTHYEAVSGNKNHAQYQPYDGQSGPFILMAPGDGYNFENLMVDSDVASHELGHHIVYSSVTGLYGDSLVIHEGMADAITFMRSGDSCLGESICPVKENPAMNICQVYGKCLRNAETTMKYQDANYATSPRHLQGRVISGLFWDLYKSEKIPVVNLQKLVIATTWFLPPKADMASFVVALLDADYALFDRRYQAVLMQAAAERGLGVDTLGISADHIDGVAPQSRPPNSPAVWGSPFSNNARPTWAWASGGGGNGTFRYLLDNIDLTRGATVTSALSFTPTSPLIDGDHVLYVQEQNQAGQWSLSGSGKISVDTTAPTVFSITGPSKPSNSQTPTVTWGAATDSNGVTYTLKVANSRDCVTGVTQTYPDLSNLPGSGYQMLANLTEGTWYACVTAVDGAGNTTKASNNGYQFSVDLTAPFAPVVSGPTIINTATPTWNWTSGGGGGGIFRYSLNNSNLTTGFIITTSSSFTPSSGLSDGTYVLYVQERDMARNWSPSGSKTIVIDTTPPTAFSITSPAKLINSPTPTVTWGAATDSNGVTYTLKVANSRDCATGVTQTYPAMSNLSGSGSQKLTNLTEGTWYACVTAVDAAGNTTKASNDGYQFSVDVTPPAASVVSGLPQSPNSATSISAQVGDQSVISYQYAVLSSYNSNCTAGVSYSNWTDVSTLLTTDLKQFGNAFITLCLIGRDGAGNVQTIPSIYRWLRISGTPNNTLIRKFAAITIGVKTSGKQTLNFVRNSNSNSAEKGLAFLCKYSKITGKISSCLRQDVAFKVGQKSTAALFAPMSPGNWVGILIPNDPNRGRAVPLEIIY